MSTGAKDRDAVVTKNSKRSTDVDADKNSTQAVWKRSEHKPSRIFLTRRLAQREIADCEGHNDDKRVVAGKSKLP